MYHIAKAGQRSCWPAFHSSVLHAGSGRRTLLSVSPTDANGLRAGPTPLKAKNDNLNSNAPPRAAFSLFPFLELCGRIVSNSKTNG